MALLESAATRRDAEELPGYLAGLVDGWDAATKKPTTGGQ